MSPEEFRLHIKSLARKHPLYARVHPFWRAVFKGRLPLDSLRQWALDIYPFVRDFPKFYMHVAVKAPDVESLTFLGETIFEETGGGKISEAHSHLFMTFMKGIGIQPENISPEPPSEAGKAIWKYGWKTSREAAYLEGLAFVGLGVERPLPSFFGLLAEAFEKRYQIDPACTHFFSIHTQADVKHSQTALRLVLKTVSNESEQAAVEQSMRGLWDLQYANLNWLMFQTGTCRPGQRRD